MARILILGGGFAAISAAESLASAVGDGHEIILVSKSPNFTFFPAIVPMVFGDIKPEEIQFDLRPKLVERNIKFVQGAVRAIDNESRTVNIACDAMDRVIGFDYLIVAVGRGPAAKAVPGLSKHAHHLLTVDAALKFKQAISGFDSGAIVVGLCPGASLPVPVCEAALALADRFEAKIGRGDISLTVVVPTTLDNAFAGSALFRDIEAAFDRKGIHLVSDFPITRVEKDTIVSAFGTSLHHDLLMLVPPFSGQPCLSPADGITDMFGFARVNSLMQLNGSTRIYVAGEIVSMPGPKFGYAAMRQGRVAAANVLAELNGEVPNVEYVHQPAWVIGEKYTDPVFFHYGVWDETLSDFNEDALFGMARGIRQRYGPIDVPRVDFECA
jgi:sulfide:quinone oxidoreductase